MKGLRVFSLSLLFLVASCGRGNHIIEVKKDSLLEPKPGKPPGVEPITEPFTIFEGTCSNDSVSYYGESRRVSLRIYPKGICPADQNEKTPVVCLKDYPFVIAREFFLNMDCKGNRSGALSEFYTYPEEKGAFGAGVAINSLTGPTFLRVEGESLLKRYTDSRFCEVPWVLNQNTEVTGKTCGMNEAFLTEKTPVFGLWKKSEAVIQLGTPALNEAERAKILDDSLLFKIR